MSTEPIAFLRETFPQLFNKGVSLLRSRAEAGDARAKTLLDDVTAVTGAARLDIDDNAPIYLSAKQGTLTAGDGPADGVEVRIAAALPGDATHLLLGEAVKAGALDNDDVAIGAAQTASKRVEDALAGRTMLCHVFIHGVPDLDEVKLRVGVNVAEPPAEPGFTCNLEYSDLEALQEGKTNAQELFMGGKLKMEGDYSAALQIAMQLLTNPL